LLFKYWMAICSPIASPWSPSERKWTPAKLRPRAALEASLFSSDAHDAWSGHAHMPLCNETTSSAAVGSVGFKGFALFALSARPCTKASPRWRCASSAHCLERAVTHAPATVWHALEPCGPSRVRIGLPSGYCVARRSVSLPPSRPVKACHVLEPLPKFVVQEGRSPSTSSHAAPLFLQNSRRPPTASGRMRMACCHLCVPPPRGLEL